MKQTAPFLALGADKITTFGYLSSIVSLFVIIGITVARLQFIGIALFLVLPFIIFFIFKLFTSAQVGFLSLLFWAFLGVGSGKYASSALGGSVVGLGIDFLLLFILFAASFSGMVKKEDLRYLKSPTMAFTIIWFGINVMQMFNPLSPGFEAWFYAGRGVSFYMLFCIPLAIVLFNKQKNLETFLLLWIILSVIGTIWGMKQKFIGLDRAETEWLMRPANLKTHLLFGQLRIFSFYTDAGQFGAAQGHAGVTALILALGPSTKRKKIFYGLAGMLCLYGMIISGTRGAIAVPAVGFLIYLVLSKNWKILSIGILILAGAYGFLKYTYIGQDNYDIRRLRTSLDPNNASLHVRLVNQARLAEYLNSHPFGGGVGAGGFWGNRFKPGSFLADLALDSWYVRIASDYGWFGLAYYLIMILYFIFSGFFVVFRMNDEGFRQQLAAIYAGMVGVAVASYGNQVWGQMPTGIIIYIILAFLSVVPMKYKHLYSKPKLA
jgi:hypothetical protein